jgi:hypothetical protein
MPDAYLEREERETGHPCPRRGWPSPDGPVILMLCTLGTRSESAHLFRELFGAYFGRETPKEQQRVVRWILRAYGDPLISAALWPKQE